MDRILLTANIQASIVVNSTDAALYLTSPVI